MYKLILVCYTCVCINFFHKVLKVITVTKLMFIVSKLYCFFFVLSQFR